jgi:phosphoribosylformylglycinamidine cyclo-ligase
VARLVRSTATEEVVGASGGFGGLFAPDLASLQEPVLVASADGVGTKLEVARRAGDLSTVGRDLVNHCVNDVLVQGARPLFFLDYVGTGVLDPERLVELISGVAAGCRENGCTLLGGETAEMPGFYREGDYELVGFIVGLADRPELLGPERVRSGDRLVGLPSAGLHTNGYSLARQVVFDRLRLGIDDPLPGVGSSVREALLAPHLSYLRCLEPLLGRPSLHALAHVTGGGLTDNLPRALPEGLGAMVEVGSWAVPPIFHLIQEQGEVSDEEMLGVFNQGIGMVLVVDAAALAEVVGELRRRGEKPVEIGWVEEGQRRVRYDRSREGG